jgi:hypothetical protein
MNGDRKVDGADIPAFVDALLSGQPPPPVAGEEGGPAATDPGVQSVNFETAARE